MKRTRKQKGCGSHAVMMSAIVASTFSTRAVTPVEARERPKSRYEEAIADVIRSMRLGYSPPSQQSDAAQFAIPSGPLSDAVALFQTQTGITVTFTATNMRDITSPGASGRLTAAQALQELLSGTGLIFRFVQP